MVKGKTCKTLIIAPHIDDEVYGCSSYLWEENIIVLYVTSNHATVVNGDYIKENRTLVESLGFQAEYIWPLRHKSNFLDLNGQANLIDEFEKVINAQKPELVLIPSPSYNQDHRMVYDAALTAMRPHDIVHFVKRILLYEEPDTWGTMRKPSPFNANYYRKLDLEFKLKLMSIYKSQLRGHRTPEHIEAIARVRGMQANMEYAEAFEVVRWIE